MNVSELHSKIWRLHLWDSPPIAFTLASFAHPSPWSLFCPPRPPPVPSPLLSLASLSPARFFLRFPSLSDLDLLLLDGAGKERKCQKQTYEFFLHILVFLYLFNIIYQMIYAAH